MQVPFEVLIRRQIARLLDPSLQCARFIYDELIKVKVFFGKIYMLHSDMNGMMTVLSLF